MMPWLLASPDCQQLCYWICMMNGPVLVSHYEEFELLALYQHGAKYKTQTYFMFPEINSPWLNYVPRKVPDVRSRYALYTNMRRFIYCMLCFMYECSAAFTIRSVFLPLITPFSHDSLTKTRPLPFISVRLLFILYCYNLQTRYFSLVLKFQTTL